MKILPLSDLSSTEVCVRRLSCVDLVPVNRRYRSANGRSVSGLLYFIEGTARFFWESGEVNVSPRSLVYLPEGSTHTYEATSERVHYLRIDFRMTDAEGEPFTFGEHPLLIAVCADDETERLCRGVREAFLSDLQRMKSLLYALFSRFAEAAGQEAGSGAHEKIAPALRELDVSFAKPLAGPELAALCGLSGTHFRRLFREATGESPTAYRNRRRVTVACRLLVSSDCTVTELSEQLGFESPYYFSRVFRAVTGTSPTAWRSGGSKESENLLPR